MGDSLGGSGLNMPTIAGRVPHHPSRGNNHNVQRLLEQAEKNSGLLDLQGAKKKADVEHLITLEDIGHGCCGTVSKCSYEGVIMAVKTMPRTQNTLDMSRIFKELNCLSNRFFDDCPYIVSFYGYFITPFDVRVCMEYMATGLDRLLIHIKQPIPEKIIGKLIISIIKALDYLKTTHQIMHRDVKPSNILFHRSGFIKLRLGIAGRLIESRAHTQQAGSRLYLAPERLDENNLNGFDHYSDIWPLGVTLVEIATGKYPFAGSEADVVNEIINGEPPRLKQTDGFSTEFCDIVERCLQRDPTMRPNYTELLEHPFVKFHETRDTDVAEWMRDSSEVVNQRRMSGHLDTMIEQLSEDEQVLRDRKRRAIDEFDQQITILAKRKKFLQAARGQSLNAVQGQAAQSPAVVPLTPIRLRDKLNELKATDPKLNTDSYLGGILGNTPKSTIQKFRRNGSAGKDALEKMLKFSHLL